MDDVGEFEKQKKPRRRRTHSCHIDKTGFHNGLTDTFDSEIIVKADFVPNSTLRQRNPMQHFAPHYPAHCVIFDVKISIQSCYYSAQL